MVGFLIVWAVSSAFVYVFSFLLESLFFSRVMDNPSTGIVVSTCSAALLCFVLFVFYYGGGVAFDPARTALFFVLAAALVIPARLASRRLRGSGSER